MRKVVIGIIAAMAVLTVGTISVFAAGTGQRQNGNENGTSGGICSGNGCNYNYTDVDNDGICDNKEEGCKYTDSNNYVDDNGDGICDNKYVNCKNANRNRHSGGYRK